MARILPILTIAITFCGQAYADSGLPPLPPFGSAEKYALLHALGEDVDLPEREAEQIAVGEKLGVGPAPFASTTVAGVTPGMLEKLLKPHFEAANLAEPYGVEFYGAARNGFNVTLPTAAYTAIVTRFDIDDGTFRFEAEIVFRNADDPSAYEEKIVVKGKAENMALMLSPGHDVARGDRITKSDLTRVAVPTKRNLSDALTEEKEIIGKVAKRRLRAGDPIRARDLEEPTLVKRNSAIDVEYVAPYISLRTTGKALESGGLGEIVRVRSGSSGKIIEAMVTAENTARLVTEIK